MESKLLHLHQGNQPMCHFISEFCDPATKLTWGDTAPRSFFMERLADYIQDEMALREAPKTLGETVDLVLQVDQQIVSWFLHATATAPPHPLKEQLLMPKIFPSRSLCCWGSYPKRREKEAGVKGFVLTFGWFDISAPNNQVTERNACSHSLW